MFRFRKPINIKNLKRVGFFKEFVGGYGNAPSILDAVSDTPHKFEQHIINYLNSGYCICMILGIEHDVLNPSEKVPLPPYILTDGVWQWSQTIIYYIQKYHIVLDKQFILHMQKSNWEISNKGKCLIKRGFKSV